VNCDLSATDATCPRCGFVSKVRGAIRQCTVPVPEMCGPGCQLKRLLGWVRIKDDGSCGCDAHAAEMDAKGADWCESAKGEATILGWLREASAQRFPLVPWVDAPARLLIRQAIQLARLESAKNSMSDDASAYAAGHEQSTSSSADFR
jgi:hypothetical protein